jgi:hypothetical protein
MLRSPLVTSDDPAEVECLLSRVFNFEPVLEAA